MDNPPLTTDWGYPLIIVFVISDKVHLQQNAQILVHSSYIFSHNHICLRSPDFEEDTEHYLPQKIPSCVLGSLTDAAGLRVSHQWDLCLSVTESLSSAWIKVLSGFAYGVSCTDWPGWFGFWTLIFRFVPCHSQPGHQCPHQRQCYLWREGAWDVLQARGARAGPACSTRPVPGLWW